MKFLSFLFHKHDGKEPCPFMVKFLHRSISGNLNRFWSLYVRAHVARCGPCRRFYESLQALAQKLKNCREEIDSSTVERLMRTGLDSQGP